MNTQLFKLLLCIYFIFNSIVSQELEEFKVKRKDVFEFTDAPKLEKIDENKYLIVFTSKDYCDVTIAIETPDGKIRRHLAMGVLGDNAPKPFTKSSLNQKIEWDGKDDEGVYIDDLAACQVRVSLGLKPVFEKKLFSSPYKRISNIAPILAVEKSGVYTFEGLGTDFIKHFDHKGDYIKTVYPFPVNKLKEVKGLKYFTSFLDGKTYPEKLGYNQATHLTSGSSSGGDAGGHLGGYAASAMAVKNGHIALAYERLNRLGVDGTTKGMELNGPQVSIIRKTSSGTPIHIGPTSAAFSPDNKYLYLTGYVFKTGIFEDSGDAYHVVFRMEYAKNEPLTIFKGKVENDKGIGSDNESFAFPSSVDVDDKGRVYISDFGNNRIQVYAEDGKFLKTIPVPLPAKVEINVKTQEIIVYSCKLIGIPNKVLKDNNINFGQVKNTVANLGTFDNIKAAKPEDLPISGGNGTGQADTGGQIYQFLLDPYAEKETLWAVGRQATSTVDEARWASGGNANQGNLGLSNGIRLFQKEGEKWKEIMNFSERAQKDVVRVKPPVFASQRLMFNPSDGCLYVGEDVAFWKSFDELIKINPDTGEISLVPIPFDAAAIVFWYHDIAYLRSANKVLRFNSKTWKEIPWDYGTEEDRIYFQTFAAPRRSVPAISALTVPSIKPVHWQLGGLSVNAKGNLAVVCYAPKVRPQQRSQKTPTSEYARLRDIATNLVMYPGRSDSYLINIYDKYGKILKEDVFPGLPYIDNIGIDKNDDIYVMLGAVRYVNETKQFKEFTDTLIKVIPNKSHMLTTSGLASVPLQKSEIPQRSPDLLTHFIGNSWIEEKPEWMYGGVGHGAQGGCACWHSEFALDLYGRSFVPEASQYQIAVLDPAGNLVMRFGQYSNADSYGASSPLPLGGDEIGMMLAHYVGVDTDHRVFIADTGNQRILSVKLNYAVDVKMPFPSSK